MAYIEPKDAVLYLLETGDRDILAKVDPARRDELNNQLRIARAKLQNQLQKSNKPQTEYQRLLQKSKKQDNPLMRGVEPWPQGNSYIDQLGIKIKYVPLKNSGE